MVNVFGILGTFVVVLTMLVETKTDEVSHIFRMLWFDKVVN